MTFRRIIISAILIGSFSFYSNAQSESKKISLDNIYKEYQFYPRGIENIRSMNDGEHYTILEGGKYIQKYNYLTREIIDVIFDLTKFKDAPIQNFTAYEFSSDESKILLTTERENIYRHSFVASFYVADLKTNEIYPLSTEGKQQLATFSPDGSKIAFVRNNNLYFKDLDSNTEKAITIDGEYNKIINGSPDWVYEEEFGFNKAFDWSPDGNKIAFYRFDESNVKEFNMTMYEELYPEWYRFKYPKAGEENSVVTIHIFDLLSSKTIVADIGEETDQYIPRIKWTKDPNTLSIVRLNRLQNEMHILHSNAKSGFSEVVYKETEDKYISEVSDAMITYLDNGKEFIIISEQDNYSHFYLYNFITKTISEITKGDFDISALYGFDEKEQRLYYASYERSSLNQDVYSIKLNGKGKKLLTDRAGWNEADFSSGFKYFINTYSNINTPAIYSLRDKQGKEIGVLQENEAFKNRMKEYGFAKTEFFKFTTSENIELNGYMIKPKDFDENKSYPLFMFVYGGPESQNVKDQFSMRSPWFQYLTQQGYIVACVDNRGTNGRGEEFRKSSYMQLGKLETIDQIEAANYLGSLNYIDAQRIGIFGWSYGGYMSLSCLFKGSEVFKMAISVAPVTNWRFYDTIYTERFMRTPQENAEGYDQNSPINFVEGMKGKLLLVHGMADDNVHFQNSTELVKSLVEADKQFDMQFYPNKNHGIYGGNTSFHLYTKMSEFILENL
ncbi:MAG: S9 family peptidase [Bacteroidales bacterium]|nr:S9 family peptidase [Bacteroidales bacterium]